MLALGLCGCLLLLATTVQAANLYAIISVSGLPLVNGSASETLVLATSSIYSTFGNVTAIHGTPTFQFNSASTFTEGCDPFSPPSTVRRPWIAIIQRGTCTYFAKAINAAQSGASGVIIVDNVRSNTPVLMFSSSTEPRAATSIVSVSLTYNAALRLVSFMDQHTNVSMSIAPGEDVPAETTPQPSVSFMFLNNLIVGVVAIGAFSFCVMFGFYMRHRNRRFVPQHDPARDEHMREAREVLLRLPTRSFISLSGHALDENDSPACAVCLENFKDGDLLRTLPCNHEMHQACIDPWLADHSTCPLCKRDICDAPLATANATTNATATINATVNPVDQDQTENPGNEPTARPTAGAVATDIALNPLAGPRPHALIVVGPAEDAPVSPNARVAPPNTLSFAQPLQSVIVEDMDTPAPASAAPLSSSSSPAPMQVVYELQVSSC